MKAKGKIITMVLLAGVLPWLASVAAGMIWGEGARPDEPLHEFLELAGSCVAVGVAMLLLLQARHEKESEHLAWVAAALLAMGLLDAAHGLSRFGLAWSWLRHGATLAGGLTFAMVWLRPPQVAVRRVGLFALSVGVLALAAGLVTSLSPGTLPAAWGTGGYTPLVKAVNVVGGAGFLAAAVFFFRRYLHEPRGEHLVFASHTLLFGTAGVLFGFSHTWAADWWLWHGLRLAAYGIVMGAAYNFVVGLCSDLARQKGELENRVLQQTEQLRQEKERLLALLNSMPDEVWFADAERNFALVSPAGQTEFGEASFPVPVEAVVARAEVYRADGTRRPAEGAPALRALKGEVIRGEEEIVRSRSRGEFRHRQVNASPVRDAAGRIIGSVAVVRDVTERKRAEEALRKSEERFDLAGRGAGVGIWDWDIETGKVYFSPRWKSLFGYEEQEIGESVEDWARLLHPEEKERICTLQEDFLAGTGSRITIEYRLRHKDGAYRWIEAHGLVLRDETGKARRFVGSHGDITARKRAEEKIAEHGAILAGINRIFREVLGSESAERLGQVCLEVAEEITGSRFGFVGEIGSDGLLHDIAISDPGWAACAVSTGAGSHRPPRRNFKIHGIYGRVLLDGKGFFTNDPESHPDRVGLPEGHPPLKAFLGVPLTREGRTVGMIAMGNREGGYTAEQQEALEALAPAVQEALDRKRAEEALQSHRELLETVVTNMPAAVNLMRGTDLKLQLVNTAYQAIAPGKVMLGKTLDQLWPETGGDLTAICLRVLETGESYHEEDAPYTICRTPGGPTEKAYFSWSLHRVELPGQGWGVLNTAWETTARVRTEEALRQSEERFRVAQELSPDGFTILRPLRDGNGRVVDFTWIYQNDAAARLTGKQPGELFGRGLLDVFPGHRGTEFLKAYLEVAETGERRVFEAHYGAETIGPAWLRVAVVPVGTDIAVLAQDITRQRAFQSELERLVAERTAKLQELVGELEHFSYTITHDMRSPLRAMKGFADMINLTCSECGHGQAKEFLGRISVAADRMDRLITDALNYSRAVRQELPLEDVDTGALLRGMLDTYPEFQASKAQIFVAGKLPVVLGNQAGLTQCFSNLLGNAVKFVKPGQMPQIRVWAEEREGWARIWVEDQGIGISPQMQPRIFEMFSRGSKDYDGTGIGLALVRKVTQRMGGKVGVESEEGRGTRVWLELKIGRTKPVEVLKRSAGTASNGGTALYIEDEEGDAVFMRMAFESRGVGGALRVVHDGRAAIEYFSGAGKYGDRNEYPMPKVVLLDLNLPEVPGFEVLKWMRNNPDFAATPVVVFSSSAREDDRVRARELGASEFIPKPASGMDFGQVVDVLLERWLAAARKS